MDREDLNLAIVALTARVRAMEPALDVLAAEEGPRLRAIAAVWRQKHQGFATALEAADELDTIAERGAGVLARGPKVELPGFIEILQRLASEAPTNRRSRRANAAIEERKQSRIRRSERLRAQNEAFNRANPDRETRH